MCPFHCHVAWMDNRIGLFVQPLDELHKCKGISVIAEAQSAKDEENTPQILRVSLNRVMGLISTHRTQIWMYERYSFPCYSDRVFCLAHNDKYLNQRTSLAPNSTPGFNGATVIFSEEPGLKRKLLLYFSKRVFVPKPKQHSYR